MMNSMLEHFKGDEVFVKKILDYQFQATHQQRMILTPFYNPHEQDIVKSVIGKELQVKSYGGFVNAENCRMIICPDFYDITLEDFQIQLVEILYHQQFGQLKHKDVLGALMNVGIKRECIGDINDGERLFFACTTQTYPYIQASLHQIKRAKVRLRECHENIEIVHDFVSRTFILSSMRLDKVVASLFKISRQNASMAIRSGSVKVNHKMVEEVSYLCHNNDMISFKHHGRVKLVDEKRQTRQGNFVVTGYFYK